VAQSEAYGNTQLRTVRTFKTRCGGTDDVGSFSLTESGIASLASPSGLFLSGQREAVPGTCVTITLDGRRPMPVEIQALTTHQVAPNPRRTTAGVDSSRVSMTLAVLHGRLGVDTGARDVYVATVGGARVTEPACELAIALAVEGARGDV